jgi:acyl-CoA thioester hydrolase
MAWPRAGGRRVRIILARVTGAPPPAPTGDVPVPFDAYRDVVRPEWIDHNQHMNMGYYLVVFDLATDEFFAWVGLDADHRRQRHVTTFCLEAHVTYHHEVRAGDPLRFTTLLLAHDPRRLHYIHTMYHAVDGYLAATNELLSLHVSLATRRNAPMADEILARLAAIQAAHDTAPRPPQVGQTIGIRARRPG